MHQRYARERGTAERHRDARLETETESERREERATRILGRSHTITPPQPLNHTCRRERCREKAEAAGGGARAILYIYTLNLTRTPRIHCHTLITLCPKRDTEDQEKNGSLRSEFHKALLQRLVLHALKHAHNLTQMALHSHRPRFALRMWRNAL